MRIPDHYWIWRKHGLRLWVERIVHERGLGVTVERGNAGLQDLFDPRETWYFDVCLHMLLVGVRLGFRYKRKG